MSGLFSFLFVGSSPELAHATVRTHHTDSRRRRERQPVPDCAKDEIYFQKRKRNNLAAKKCRETRKAEEDIRAARLRFLEMENVSLRAQVTMLTKQLNAFHEQPKSIVRSRVVGKNSIVQSIHETVGLFK